MVLTWLVKCCCFWWDKRLCLEIPTSLHHYICQYLYLQLNQKHTCLHTVKDDCHVMCGWAILAKFSLAWPDLAQSHKTSSSSEKQSLQNWNAVTSCLHRITLGDPVPLVQFPAPPPLQNACWNSPLVSLIGASVSRLQRLEGSTVVWERSLVPLTVSCCVSFFPFPLVRESQS